MNSDVPFAIKYRVSGAGQRPLPAGLAGALERRAPRAVEDRENNSFEELRNRIWGAASCQEERRRDKSRDRENYWKARSKKIKERLALEAEIYAERQSQRAIDQELYAQHLQQQQINERAVLSEQGLEPGMIGLVCLVPPIMQGTMAPILH